ncbi:hypothetical protein OG21DRAFT_1202259 [Imleria badia]|nr:hypothetical protein OG21DRAFT_1202259 [Imleria badia]
MVSMLPEVVLVMYIGSAIMTVHQKSLKFGRDARCLLLTSPSGCGKDVPIHVRDRWRFKLPCGCSVASSEFGGDSITSTSFRSWALCMVSLWMPNECLHRFLSKNVNNVGVGHRLTPTPDSTGHCQRVALLLHRAIIRFRICILGREHPRRIDLSLEIHHTIGSLALDRTGAN